jgi:hypothetical protein
MAQIPLLDDVAVADRLGEARPAGAAVELVDGREQRFARDDVDVKTGLVVSQYSPVNGRSVPLFWVT